MTKRSLKLLLTIFIIMVTLFSFSKCFADDVELTLSTASEETTEDATAETETTEAETAEEEDEIYYGDLYLFDTNVVMDKLVDGNVFIVGSNVEITGQVNGNLYVCASTLSFNSCYVKNDIFAFANSVYYNGACNDLYVAATNKLEMTYDSYVVRDVKATSSDITFKAAVGRDADLSCDSISFGEEEDIPIIYGNLRYTASQEVTVPEGVMSDDGTVTYTQKNSITNTTSILTILLAFLTYIVTAIIVYLLIKAIAPKFLEKLDDNKHFSIINLLKYIGIGLVSILSVSILCIILLLTKIGVTLAIILALMFIFICIISIPAFSIAITNLFKSKLKLDSTVMYLLVLSLINIVIYGITLIPVVGGIISLIIILLAVGMIINMFIPKKELSDEEKADIEKKIQEKRKEKENKKQAKLEAKEAKKKEKND